MAEIVIKVENLLKRYQLDRRVNRTLKESIVQGVKGLFSGARADQEFIHALDGISFEIKKGSTVGIVGPNGSGKSTLLKILSKITAPTEGQVTIKGKVASLLEVGTGFHPDLTGRENIRMNGVVLGMEKTQVENRLEEIISFSGIRKFIDAPVKTYSSGMLLRLAFSVITVLDSDIMLFDEVLAVGDSQFKEKSFLKIRELIQMGRTVIVCSHNLSDIQNLCETVIYLKQGKIEAQGPPSVLISQYLRTEIFEPETSSEAEAMDSTLDSTTTQTPSDDQTANKRNQQRNWINPDPLSSPSAFRLVKCGLAPKGKHPYDSIYPSDPIEIALEFEVATPRTRMDAVMIVSDQTKTFLFASSTFISGSPVELIPNGEELTFIAKVEIPGNLLNEGYFYVSFDFFVNQDPQNHIHPYKLLFKVEKDPAEIDFSGIGYPGYIRPILSWEKG